jgi:hypothetical protein
MLEKIKNAADGAIDVGIKLISLSIILQVIFGSKVAFLTGDVIDKLISLMPTSIAPSAAFFIFSNIFTPILIKQRAPLP